MKFKELKNLSKEELEKKIDEIQFSLLKDRAQSGAAGKNVGRINASKKAIARIKTLLSQGGGDSKA